MTASFVMIFCFFYCAAVHPTEPISPKPRFSLCSAFRSTQPLATAAGAAAPLGVGAQRRLLA